MANSDRKMLVQQFGGLRTSIANPPSHTARDTSNVELHRKMGTITNARGYGVKYNLPQVEDSEDPEYLDPDVHKITNLVWRDFFEFFTDKHDGKNLTVAVATYRKTSRYDPDVHVDRSGVWVRPFWNGSEWVDEWRELTECHIVQLAGTDEPSRLKFDLYEYPDNYFRDWIVVFENYSRAEDHDNYLLVTESGNDTTNDYVDFFGEVTALNRPVGSKMLLVRSFLGKEMPDVVDAIWYKVLDEMRLTTGNGEGDVRLMAGVREKTFGWPRGGRNVKRIICEPSTFDYWRGAWGLDGIEATSPGSNTPLENGTYSLKTTLVLDDGQETELRSVAGKGLSLTSGLFNPYFNVDVLPFDQHSGYPDTFDHDEITAICGDGVFSWVSTNERRVDTSDPDNIDYFLLPSLVKLAKDGVPLAHKDAGDTYAAMIVLGSLLYGVFGDKFRRHNADLSGGEDGIVMPTNAARCLATDGTFVFVGHDTSPGKVTKVQVTPTVSVIDTLELSAGSNLVRALVYHDGFLYAGCYTSDAKIVKIDPDTMTEVDTLTLDAGEEKCRALAAADGKLFAGLETAPAIIVKIDPDTMVREDDLTFGTDQDFIYGLHSDGSHLFAVSPTFGLVSRINPDTLEHEGIFNPAVGGSINNVAGNVQGVAIVPVTDGFAVLDTDPSVQTYENRVWFVTLSAATTISVTNQIIRARFIASASTFPLRASRARIYGSKDGDSYLLLTEMNLLTGGITWDPGPYLGQTSIPHFYHRSQQLIIDGTVWEDAGAEASAQIGRAIDDSGSVRFRHAAVIGRRTYASGVRRGETIHRNTLFASGFNGDGAAQVDVFPSDGSHMIDLDYGDGDELVCAGGVDELIVAIKRRSIVVLEANTSVGFERRLVSRSYGICSSRSLVQWDDELFWAAHSGIVAFSTRGVRLLNRAWLSDWLELTDEEREAAVAVIDPLERQYRIAAGGREYVLDLDSGEWTAHDLVDHPGRFALNTTGSGLVDFLSGGRILSLGQGTLHADEEYTIRWESNEEYAPDDTPHLLDVNVKRLWIQYRSDVNVTVKLYKNGETNPIESFVASKDFTRARFNAPINSRGSSFRLAVEATLTEADQTVEISKLGAVYEIVQAGGDIKVE